MWQEPIEPCDHTFKHEAQRSFVYLIRLLVDLEHVSISQNVRRGAKSDYLVK